MGTLLSRSKDIKNLRFEPFPTRPTSIEKVVRVGRVVVATSKSGVIYTTGRVAREAAFMPGDWPWQGDLLKACVRLGVVSPDVVQAYLEECKARDLAGEASIFLKHDVERLKALGIVLTADQTRTLRRIAQKAG